MSLQREKEINKYKILIELKNTFDQNHQFKEMSVRRRKMSDKTRPKESVFP